MDEEVYKEEKITIEEGDEMLDGCNDWKVVGETTNGNAYWNNKTGEMLFDDGNHFTFNRKV